MSDDPDSVAEYILETAQRQGAAEARPKIYGGKKASFMLVEFGDGVGYCLDQDDAAKWWELYAKALRDDWLTGARGEGEKAHESLNWRRYVKGDKTVRATVEYEGHGPGDIETFMRRLAGRRIVEASINGTQLIAKIDLA